MKRESVLLQHSAAGELFLMQKIDLPGKNRRLLLGEESLPWSLLTMFPFIVMNLNVVVPICIFLEPPLWWEILRQPTGGMQLD